MAHASNQSHFATVPRADIPRAKFKRDSNLHTTIDAGYLTPIFLDEVLPGDTFILKEHVFGRLATPLKPLMDNLYLDTFYFFVPTRLLWDNWQKFNGEQVNPGDSTDYLVPTIEITDAQNTTIYDYFGIPTNVETAIDVNTLPFRAYDLIWSEWFRDQNLQDSPTFIRDDGPDFQEDYFLRKRGKRHDYFTSSLPWLQKGEAVTLPLGTSANIVRDSNAAPWQVYDAYTNTLSATNTVGVNGANSLAGTEGTFPTYSLDPMGGLSADLTTATAATINSLREAFQVQKLLERDARGGTRYTEILRAHFGVVSPDARLQRPEYLGGSSSRIGISPVANTTGTEEAHQGDLSGVGTVSSSGRGFTQSFTEHGYIIGLVSLRGGDLNYQQGLHRLWSRQTRFDFYWPALSHLGEQAILSKEIYCDGNETFDNEVFGYQERYAEYKYKPNMITGKFRSNDPQSLDVWHLAQDFGSRPHLNSDFIEENPPMARVLAVPTEPHLILDAYFDLDTVRPMPMYSVPGLVDHF